MHVQKGGKKRASGKKAPDEELFNAFHVLSLSVLDLYHSLKKARSQFHRKELPDPKWNVITILEHRGPQTVPQIARSRKLSRQSIQTTVNRLLQDEYVDVTENPAHKKSPLISLTAKGRALADEMNRREKELVSRIRIGIPSGEMLKAAEVMQSLKTFFEGRHWKELLQETKGGRR